MTPIPSEPGDVLILHWRSLQKFHVGRVWRKGQQDFSGQFDVMAFNTSKAAGQEAKKLKMTPDHHVYWVELEEDKWTCLTQH